MYVYTYMQGYWSFVELRHLNSNVSLQINVISAVLESCSECFPISGCSHMFSMAWGQCGLVVFCKMAGLRILLFTLSHIVGKLGKAGSRFCYFVLIGSLTQSVIVCGPSRGIYMLIISKNSRLQELFDSALGVYPDASKVNLLFFQFFIG